MGMDSNADTITDTDTVAEEGTERTTSRTRARTETTQWMGAQTQRFNSVVVEPMIGEETTGVVAKFRLAEIGESGISFPY